MLEVKFKSNINRVMEIMADWECWHCHHSADFSSMLPKRHPHSEPINRHEESGGNDKGEDVPEKVMPETHTHTHTH